jgi:hypothetical protein
MNIQEIKRVVSENCERVAKLGNWPRYISPDSLLSRIPDGGKAPGFDAGIACCLGLIPEDKQKLSATLHAAYTPAAVEQVRREIALDDDKFYGTETFYWLLACSYCTEEQTEDQFFNACLLVRFIQAPESIERARKEYKKMTSNYKVADNVAWAVVDGGIQGAYLDGLDLGVQFNHGIFFVSTYKESLGIPENFKWVDPPTKERPMSNSGPVWGSKQYVKCATAAELFVVLLLARSYLGV